MSETLVGLGYRKALAHYVRRTDAPIACLEITAEHFFDVGDEQLRALRRRFPLMVHGLGLSLGTPGPLDAETLERLARVIELADPLWVSEHVAFTRAGGIDLGHLNPIPYTREALEVMTEHTLQLAERVRRPVVLENITSHIRPQGELSEPEFLSHLCERTGAELLLDVTNLYVNAHNHGFCPRAYLRELDPRHVRQLHVVGYGRAAGRHQDHHGADLQPELWSLLSEVLTRFRPGAVIIERDRDFPNDACLTRELLRLRHLCNPGARPAGVGHA